MLDSFRSLWGGKENDSGEVAAVLDPLRNLVRRVGAGGLLLHHSGRSSGQYRGSSAIGASAELGFGLHRTDNDSDHARRYLETWKCRPAPEPPRRWLRLAAEAGRVFVEPAEAAAAVDVDGPPGASAPVREELRPRVLAALTAQEQPRAVIARAVGREAKDRSVGRVLEDLKRNGEAERGVDGWREVASGRRRIGGRHPATLDENPHGDAKNAGGTLPATLSKLPPSDNGSSAKAADAFIEQAKQVFPGSYELPPEGSA